GWTCRPAGRRRFPHEEACTRNGAGGPGRVIGGLRLPGRAGDGGEGNQEAAAGRAEGGEEARQGAEEDRQGGGQEHRRPGRQALSKSSVLPAAARRPLRGRCTNSFARRSPATSSPPRDIPPAPRR